MITLCIPTFNRPEYLAILLNFYARISKDIVILIGDAGPNDATKKNIETIRKSEIRDQITLVRLPGKPVLQTMEILAKKVTTPYAVLNCDDDYYLPSVFGKFTSILEKRPDLIGVNGGVALCNFSNEKLFHYRMRSLLQESPISRMQSIADDYFGLLFSIFKTENFRKIFVDHEISNKAAREELVPAMLAATSGKILHISDYFLLRSVGHSRTVLPVSKVSEETIKDLVAPVVTNILYVDQKMDIALATKSAADAWCKIFRQRQGKFEIGNLRFKLTQFFRRLKARIIRFRISNSQHKVCKTALEVSNLKKKGV